MKNEPSNKEYARIARYDLHRLCRLGNEKCVLVHYKFLKDETETCILLDYDLSGPDATCTIIGPNGREDVSILSLYIKRENVLPLEINQPKRLSRTNIRQFKMEGKRLVEMEDDVIYGQFQPNLKPALGNPVYWIWWTIGATVLVGLSNLI